jgi:hypothetical protein
MEASAASRVNNWVFLAVMHFYGAPIVLPGLSAEIAGIRSNGPKPLGIVAHLACNDVDDVHVVLQFALNHRHPGTEYSFAVRLLDTGPDNQIANPRFILQG